MVYVMEFSVAPDVFGRYPNLAIGVIVATEIDNTKTPPEVTEQLRQAEKQVQNSLDSESFKEHPNIAALQEVHRSFGSNPNKFPPSVQALVKRVLKGGALPSINSLVDIYNIISLKYIVCAGAEDLDACEGDIRLAFAEGTESFRPLGEEKKDPPATGELVYKDDKGVICRKLNWREGDRTKITNSTKNAVVVLEGFAPLTREELSKALDELAGMLQKYCRAQTRLEVLTGGNTSCTVR